MRTLRIAVTLVTTLGVAACGDAGEVERNPDALVRISSGIYGRMIGDGGDHIPRGSEEGTRGATFFGNHPIHIHDGAAVLSAKEAGPPPLREVRTGDGGFFEVELAPGRYQVCIPNGTRAGSCARFEVQPGARVRGDYVVGRPSQWTIAGLRAEPSSGP